MMKVDPRLNEIDDCLYRVATKAIVVYEDKVLLVKEIPEMWWSFPGGGVDHGESVETSLVRELTEELGVTVEDIQTDFKIVYHMIGAIINGIPRMNMFYKVNISPSAIKDSDDVDAAKWFNWEEFMSIHMGPSYDDRSRLSEIIFGG